MVKSVKIKRLIWLFPFVFFIHDIEEILTVEHFLIRNSELIPYTVTTLEFALAFFLLWMVTSIGCIKAVGNKDFLGMKPVTFFSLIAAGILLANGIGHLLQFIYFKSYVPGIVTTIFILLPYCLLTLKTLLNEKLLTVNKFFLLLLSGFLIQTPAALISIIIAKRII